MIRRLRRLLGRHDEAVLVNDTSVLSGDELIEVAPGKYVAVSDFGAPVMPLRDRDGRPLAEGAEQ